MDETDTMIGMALLYGWQAEANNTVLRGPASMSSEPALHAQVVGMATRLGWKFDAAQRLLTLSQAAPTDTGKSVPKSRSRYTDNRRPARPFTPPPFTMGVGSRYPLTCEAGDEDDDQLACYMVPLRLVDPELPVFPDPRGPSMPQPDLRGPSIPRDDLRGPSIPRDDNVRDEVPFIPLIPLIPLRGPIPIQNWPQWVNELQSKLSACLMTSSNRTWTEEANNYGLFDGTTITHKAVLTQAVAGVVLGWLEQHAPGTFTLEQNFREDRLKLTSGSPGLDVVIQAVPNNAAAVNALRNREQGPSGEVVILFWPPSGKSETDRPGQVMMAYGPLHLGGRLSKMKFEAIEESLARSKVITVAETVLRQFREMMDRDPTALQCYMLLSALLKTPDSDVYCQVRTSGAKDQIVSLLRLDPPLGSSTNKTALAFQVHRENFRFLVPVQGVAPGRWNYRPYGSQRAVPFRETLIALMMKAVTIMDDLRNRSAKSTLGLAKRRVSSQKSVFTLDKFVFLLYVDAKFYIFPLAYTASTPTNYPVSPEEMVRGYVDQPYSDTLEISHITGRVIRK